MIGNYIEIFEAQTRIDRLKDNRGGGNVITSLLAYAINNNLIDKALATRYSKDYPTKVVPFISTTTEDIISCSGSKYTFVPYDGLIPKLDRSSAIVGLPCQMKSIDKSLLKIGLFCGLNLSEQGLNYIFRKLKVKEEDIAYLDYRAPFRKGLLIKLKDEREKYLSSYWWLAFFFSYRKCLYCTDYTNHFADISVGDRRPNWSVVIVRTEKGADLFNRAVSDGYIIANRIELDDFFSKVMTPMLQKEQKGGFIKSRLVRLLRGKWLVPFPINLLKHLGKYIAKKINKS